MVPMLEHDFGAACPAILSIHENVGVDELKTHVLRLLEEVRLVLDAMADLLEQLFAAKPVS